MVLLPNNTKAAQYEFSISCPTKANGQLDVNWDETGLVGAVQCSLMLKMSSKNSKYQYLNSLFTI